jgi:hypothetical protein
LVPRQGPFDRWRRGLKENGWNRFGVIYQQHRPRPKRIIVTRGGNLARNFLAATCLAAINACRR